MYDGFLFRHKDSIELAFEVVKQFFVKESQTYSLKVRWYAVGSRHSPRDLRIVERIKLPRAAFKDWVPMRYGRVPEDVAISYRTSLQQSLTTLLSPLHSQTQCDKPI
jgi:hypothetical protein